MEREVRGKLNVKEVFLEAVEIYKVNFKLMLLISFISMILMNVGTLVQAIQFIPFFANRSDIMIILVMLLSIASLILSIYNIKINAMMQRAVRDYYNGEIISFSSVYENSKGLIAGIFGASLGLGFMLVIPMIFVYCGFMIEMPIAARIIIIGIGFISSAFLGTKYGFAPVIAAIDPSQQSYFGRSDMLVKGNFKEALAVFLIAGLNVYISVGVSMILEQPSAGLYFLVTKIIISITTLFIRPFELALVVVALMKLVNIVDPIDTNNDMEEMLISKEI